MSSLAAPTTDGLSVSRTRNSCFCPRRVALMFGWPASCFTISCVLAAAHRTRTETWQAPGSSSWVLAVGRSGADVLCTDTAVLVPLLQRNVAANFADSGASPAPGTFPPRVASLRWGCPEHLRGVLETDMLKQGVHYILGSDIVYDEDCTGALLETIGAVLATEPNRQARVFLAVARRGDELKAFQADVAKGGWMLSVLHEVNLPEEIGDTSCSPIAIFELLPAPQNFSKLSASSSLCSSSSSTVLATAALHPRPLCAKRQRLIVRRLRLKSNVRSSPTDMPEVAAKCSAQAATLPSQKYVDNDCPTGSSMFLSPVSP